MTQPIRNRVDMLSTGIQTPIGIKVFGKDILKMEEIAVAIEKVLAGIDGALNPYAERTGNKPYIELEIDRMQAARYGITVGALQHVLMTAVGGMPITTTVEGRKRFPVRVRYMRELRDNVEALRRILVPTPSGAQIPLEQVVRIIRRPGPAKISSENTMPFTRIFCDVDVDKIGLVDFVERAQEELAEKIKPNLPSGYFYSFSGQYEAEIESRKTLSVVVPLCILMIFLLLYIKFRSPTPILSVFCAVLFAFVGGMWLQYLMQYVPESLGGGAQIKYSTAVWVGYIALFGIAVEDSIVIIQFLMDLVRRGGEVDESSDSLRETMRSAVGEDGRPIFTIPVALSVMVFFALCAQCAATLSVMQRETGSWKWPTFAFGYMTFLAYAAALVTYQATTALGW